MSCITGFDQLWPRSSDQSSEIHGEAATGTDPMFGAPVCHWPAIHTWCASSRALSVAVVMPDGIIVGFCNSSAMVMRISADQKPNQT